MKGIARLSFVAANAVGALVLATAAQAGGNADKVLVCHGTASATNPYVLVSVNANGLNGHFDGTDPGHGWQNAPDMIFDPTYGSCEAQLAAQGGQL